MSESMGRRMVDRLGYLLAGAFALLLAGILTGVVGAGPLEPDSPPAPTDGVRLPGTPIDSVPFTIDQPGHYYLTRNLSVASGAAITVNARNVSIDLGGFTLVGNEVVPTTGINVTLTGSTRVRIENGTIRNFQTGIFMANSSENRIEEVRLVANATGASLGGGTLLSDCIISKGRYGIQLYGPGSGVRNCNVNSTELIGIWALDGSGPALIERTSVVNNNTSNDLFGGGLFTAQGAQQITVRENEFSGNFMRDMNIEGDYNVIIDNALHCPFSIEVQPTAANTYAPVDLSDPRTNRSHRTVC